MNDFFYCFNIYISSSDLSNLLIDESIFSFSSGKELYYFLWASYDKLFPTPKYLCLLSTLDTLIRFYDFWYFWGQIFCVGKECFFNFRRQKFLRPPISLTIIFSSSVIRMLWGFSFLWTIPILCKYFTAWQIWKNHSAFS